MKSAILYNYRTGIFKIIQKKKDQTDTDYAYVIVDYINAGFVFMNMSVYELLKLKIEDPSCVQKYREKNQEIMTHINKKTLDNVIKENREIMELVIRFVSMETVFNMGYMRNITESATLNDKTRSIINFITQNITDMYRNSHDFYSNMINNMEISKHTKYIIDTKSYVDILFYSTYYAYILNKSIRTQKLILTDVVYMKRLYNIISGSPALDTTHMVFRYATYDHIGNTAKVGDTVTFPTFTSTSHVPYSSYYDSTDPVVLFIIQIPPKKGICLSMQAFSKYKSEYEILLNPFTATLLKSVDYNGIKVHHVKYEDALNITDPSFYENWIISSDTNVFNIQYIDKINSINSYEYKDYVYRKIILAFYEDAIMIIMAFNKNTSDVLFAISFSIKHRIRPNFNYGHIPKMFMYSTYEKAIEPLSVLCQILECSRVIILPQIGYKFIDNYTYPIAYNKSFIYQDRIEGSVVYSNALYLISVEDYKKLLEQSPHELPTDLYYYNIVYPLIKRR